jgi:death-on-curing protein
MSGFPAFLTVEQVLLIHQRMIAEFGGDPNVRDEGLLESAVAMPAARFAGKFLHEGLPAMAAAYLFHLCRNHPFVDGNKRTAVVAAEVFLQLNRQSLAVTDKELERITVGVADGSVSKKEVVAFFKRHVHKSEE